MRNVVTLIPLGRVTPAGFGAPSLTKNVVIIDMPIKNKIISALDDFEKSGASYVESKGNVFATSPIQDGQTPWGGIALIGKIKTCGHVSKDWYWLPIQMKVDRVSGCLAAILYGCLNGLGVFFSHNESIDGYISAQLPFFAVFGNCDLIFRSFRLTKSLCSLLTCLIQRLNSRHVGTKGDDAHINSRAEREQTDRYIRPRRKRLAEGPLDIFPPIAAFIGLMLSIVGMHLSAVKTCPKFL